MDKKFQQTEKLRETSYKDLPYNPKSVSDSQKQNSKSCAVFLIWTKLSPVRTFVSVIRSYVKEFFELF